MASALTNPFVAGEIIKDPTSFVGRQKELNQIYTWISGSAQPHSFNIFGEAKIGKSSLLYRIYQSGGPDSRRFPVVYLSCRGLSTPAEFYRAAANTLRDHTTMRQVKITILPKQYDAVALETVLIACNKQRLYPVFCLDDFEKLFERAQHFTGDFFNKLRSWRQAGYFVLLIASDQPVREYALRYPTLVSEFFNEVHPLKLAHFSPAEARELVSLPTGQPALSAENQQRALEWGQDHPYRLQLACRLLWDAQRNGTDWRTAKRLFDQTLHLQRPPAQSPLTGIWRRLSLIGNDLTQLSGWLNQNRMVVAIVVAALLVLSGVVTWSELIAALRKALGL